MRTKTSIFSTIKNASINIYAFLIMWMYLSGLIFLLYYILK